MTKKELIALSDLNREDNIKYISSEAQGIAIALNSDSYAPTLCKLERAYICGIRKSKKYIADLKKENKKIFNDWLEACNKYGEVYLKLTKAKELLKSFLVAKSIEDTCVAESEAERFLSEVEKKNESNRCSYNRQVD